jgi:hypothetical protein
MRSRSTIGAVAFSAWSWLSRRVRSATAERRATSSARSAESPAAARRRGVVAAERALGRGERVDAIGLAGASLAATRTLDLDDGVAGALQVLAQAGAPAARTFDPEDQRLLLAEALGPALQLGVAGGARRERQLVEHLTERVERHGPVALLVGVDPDRDHRSLLIVWNRSG